jgi:hypothetical protein
MTRPVTLTNSDRRNADGARPSSDAARPALPIRNLEVAGADLEVRSSPSQQPPATEKGDRPDDRRLTIPHTIPAGRRPEGIRPTLEIRPRVSGNRRYLLFADPLRQVF